MQFKVLFFCLFFITIELSAQVIPEKPNFIFIVVDDLNDYVGTFQGQPQVQTPVMNNIATQGVSFLNAFSNASGCAPSRTSFLSGKDPIYTQVLSNDDYIGVFRDNFTAAKGNEEVFTLPEILKDSGGYFTYAINKVFHSPSQNDYDKDTDDPCNKDLSWNNMKYFEESDAFVLQTDAYKDFGYFDYGVIPDSLEPFMQDYIATDTAIQFINDFANGTANTCDRPFFLALGYNKPHSERFIPEKYYLPFYMNDIYDVPYIIPYNEPYNAFPFNGIVMPPQPDPIYNDYYSLPENGLGRSMANVGNIYYQIEDLVNSFPILPEIDPMLTDSLREDIIFQTIASNSVANYIAAVQFVDTQIGRVLDALNEHPDLAENTIIILVSDHGYSLGEKRHWTKWSLWETDLRIPFIIADPTRPGNQICNNVVSLLDLFPTILDLADVNYPVFADGSPYLDGHSIIPLLNNTALELDNVSVTATKKIFGPGSCFPHYSIRNENFHYIRYQKNNGGDMAANICDLTEESFEEELYEIGVNRKVDPYEWNNLISNPDYDPIKKFLSEFILGGDLYLQNPKSVQINNKTLPCFLNNHTAIKFNTTLFSEVGNLIGGAALINYQFKWTNNLTPAIFYGKSYTFNTSTIPAGLFGSNNKIMFYLEVTDLLTGKPVAFNTKSIYINSANIPVADFNVVPGIPLHSVDIIDYTISGSYFNTYWTFGDGTSSEDYLPDTHIYSTSGNYTIKNFIEYGNTCLKSKARNIAILRDGFTELNFSIYPNPANDLLNIVLDEPATSVKIHIVDILGRVVFDQTFISPQGSIQINTEKLIPGNYIIKINAGEVGGNTLLEIVR